MFINYYYMFFWSVYDKYITVRLMISDEIDKAIVVSVTRSTLTDYGLSGRTKRGAKSSLYSTRNVLKSGAVFWYWFPYAYPAISWIKLETRKKNLMYFYFFYFSHTKLKRKV